MQGLVIRIYRQVCVSIALCLAVLMTAAPASAYVTPLHPCIAKVRAGDTVLEILRNLKRFDCNPSQSEYEAGDYWVKMAVTPDDQSTELRPILRIASLWDDGFSLTAVHSDGSISEYTAARIAELKAMRLGPSIMVPLDAQKPPVIMLVAKVKNSQVIHGVLFAPQLSDPGGAMNTEMALGVLYAGFGGLCLAMLVYTLALWRAMRQRFLIAYCAMVLAMAIYAFFTTGAVHYVIDGITGGERLRITTSLLAIAASTTLIFVRHFFAATVIPAWLVKVTYVQAAAMSIFAVVYSILAPNFIHLLDAIYMASFAPIPFLMAAYIHTSWKQKDPFLRYFLVAWSIPLIAVIARILHGVGILPYHMLIENSTLIAFAFEALVNSLAVGRRVWLLAQARDNAKSAEAIAKTMADTDPLTGLLNRRAFLRKLLERDSHWTLILVDIDHFKRVNDSLGHAGGDDAITGIAGVLRKYTPEGAMVARMGGEEFAISYPADLPLTPDPDRLLADIRLMSLPQGYRITASIGIAARAVVNEHDWKILYRAADMALYKAKSSGRDCFSRHEPERAAA